MLDVNVYHVAGMGKAFLDYLNKRKSKSAMVVVSSTGGSVPVPNVNVYCGTKAFCDYIVKGWHQELSNVDV